MIWFQSFRVFFGKSIGQMLAEMDRKSRVRPNFSPMQRKVQGLRMSNLSLGNVYKFKRKIGTVSFQQKQKATLLWNIKKPTKLAQQVSTIHPRPCSFAMHFQNYVLWRHWWWLVVIFASNVSNQCLQFHDENKIYFPLSILHWFYSKTNRLLKGPHKKKKQKKYW